MLRIADPPPVREPATRGQHRSACDPGRPDVAEDPPLVADPVHKPGFGQQLVELGAMWPGHLLADARDVRVDVWSRPFSPGDGGSDRPQERVRQLECVATRDVETVDGRGTYVTVRVAVPEELA